MMKNIKQHSHKLSILVTDYARIIRNVYDKYLEIDLMQIACALTHRTLLAIVPVMAMMFAIARGFNVQNFLQEQLVEHFRSQQDAINYAVSFVDSYLKHATDGIFIGVGIVALILTLYFLLDAVERSFNKIWKCDERTYTRKFSDYTAIMFWVPVLVIAAFGISVWINSGIRAFFDLPTISAFLRYLFIVVNFLIELTVFALLMMYMPNTMVKLRYAAISGLLCSVAFEALQYVFELSIYVSSYHAVYGSFAYLPLFLLWVQFSWLICLMGAQIAHSAQVYFTEKEQKEKADSEAISTDRL